MPITPHDLAYELGMATDRLLIQLRDWGVPLRSPHSRIPDPVANRLRDHFPVYVDRTAFPTANAVGPMGPATRELSTARYVMDPAMQRALALMDEPNHLPGSTDDIDRLDLVKLREGLGMTVERAAATVAVSTDHLRMVESGGGTARDVRRVMAGYGIHMAAHWASDPLRLQASTFEPGSDELLDIPTPPESRRPAHPASVRRPPADVGRGRRGRRAGGR